MASPLPLVLLQNFVNLFFDLLFFAFRDTKRDDFCCFSELGVEVWFCHVKSKCYFIFQLLLSIHLQKFVKGRSSDLFVNWNKQFVFSDDVEGFSAV